MYSFLTILGTLLVLDTAFLQSVSNGHLGTVLPAILGAPLILVGLLKTQVKLWIATPAGNIVRWVIVGLYAAFIVFFIAAYMVLSSAASKRAEYNKDVLIVLGCAVRGEKVSLTLQYRLDAALEYLEHSPDTAVIVAGGKGDGENISEAEAMKRYLVSHGIEESRIIKEDRSTSTWENFLFSKKILDERFRGASVAFVTTAFHVYRAERVAIMNGIEAAPYAAKDVWYSAPNNYLREGLAVTAYKLRGMLI